MRLKGRRIVITGVSSGIGLLLQTLSSLGNREGKLVGMISHVGALKGRIDTQIEVKKLSGGRSTLSGPGVKAVGELKEIS